jgi:hypothetical protein
VKAPRTVPKLLVRSKGQVDGDAAIREVSRDTPSAAKKIFAMGPEAPCKMQVRF